MSPRRGGDYGFASAVTNIVDQAHYISEQERFKKYGIGSSSFLLLFNLQVNYALCFVAKEKKRIRLYI
jgi:hypothetical protein